MFERYNIVSPADLAEAAKKRGRYVEQLRAQFRAQSPESTVVNPIKRPSQPIDSAQKNMAEGVGFEPTELSFSGFQDQDPPTEPPEEPEE